MGASFVVACALSAVASGSASASVHLVLKREGKAVSTGTAAYGEIVLGVDGYTCADVSRSGAVAANERAKDVANFMAGDEETTCEAGAAIAGHIERITMTSAGKEVIRADPKVTVEIPGPCLYTFRKLEGVASIPGFSDALVSGAGRLQARTSNESCATSVTGEGEIQLFDAEMDEPFETET